MAKKKKTTQLSRVFVVEELDDEARNWYPTAVDPKMSGAKYEAKCMRNGYTKTRIRKFVSADSVEKIVRARLEKVKNG